MNLWCCKTSKNVDLLLIKNNTNKGKVKALFSEPLLFKDIKLRTSKLLSQTFVDNKLNNEDRFISKGFLSKYILRRKLSIGSYDCKVSIYSDAYAFKGYKEFKNFDMFTFIYDNESGTRVLYGVTTSKQKIEIISIGVLAFSGEDNGWIGDKYGRWKNDSILEVMEIVNYDDDFVEANNNSQVDTIWSIIKLNFKGVLSEEVTRKVKYLEGRKIGEL